MLALHTRGQIEGVRERSVLKVLSIEEALESEIAPNKCVIWDDSVGRGSEQFDLRKWAGVITPSTDRPFQRSNDGIVIWEMSNPQVVAPGDVIRVDVKSSRISVLYRRGSRSNTLLATNRCNSFCLMCSQPPTVDDDHWLVHEMLEVLPLVDPNEIQLGISGGEPTLLGDDLAAVILQAKKYLPTTEIHILSNGRRFAEASYARVISAVRHPALMFGIPIYSDSPEVHDYIVQSKGAWEDTLQGLYNLAREKVSIELRIVVQQANVKRLGELASFIFRNLSFADHVAFMGLEPIGFARFNKDTIWVDPSDCSASLTEAVFFLANRGIDVSIYNFPLCTLPRDLWPFGRRSISDWKNIYLPVCDTCEVRNECCGFFSSVGSEWIGRGVKPVLCDTVGEFDQEITETKQ